MPVTSCRSRHSNNQNIDGGWAWVVAVACMLCNFFMNGFVRTFGIFFLEFLDLFQGSSSATSIIYATQLAAFSVAGLIVLAIFTELVNCRTLVMAGGVAFCLGITASSFAQTLTEAVIFIGLLGGLGQALMYGPNIVMLGKYFDRRRALAIGISGCGGSLGQLTLPPLIRLLIDFYSFRGALLIFGGLVLNCTLCGSLLRPLPAHTESAQDDNQEVIQITDRDLNPNSDKHETTVREKCQDKIPVNVNNSNRNRSMYDRELTLKSLPNLCMLPSTHAENSQVNNGSLPSLRPLATQMYGHASNNCRTQRPTSNRLLEREYTQLVPTYFHQDKITNNGASLRYSIEGDLLSASLCSIHSNRHEDSMGDTSTDIKICGVRSRLFNCYGKKILNCGILKDVLFLLLLITAVLAYVGCQTEVVFIPPHARDRGITDDQITVLVSVMGGCDLVCRILIGLVADTGWVERYKILMTGLFILGITAHLASLAHLFWHFLAISLIYGICGGALSTLMAVVLVDFFGVEMLSRSLGLVFLFQGVGISVFNPLFGWLRDTTGSYYATFHAIGACLVLAGAALLAVPLFRKWRTKRATNPDISKEVCLLPPTIETTEQ